MVVAVSFWVVLWFDFGGCWLILAVVFMMAGGGEVDFELWLRLSVLVG